MRLNQPISILDIRKEQRRLTALLRSQNDIPKSKIRRRVLLPNNYCYVCSRLAPGGKFRSPNGMFFDKCEHFPRTPYPTVVGPDGFGINRPNSESSVNIVKDILKKTKQDISKQPNKNYVDVSRAFIVKTPIGQERSRATFSVVSETDTIADESEEVLPLINQNQFLTIENIQPKHDDEVDTKSPTNDEHEEEEEKEETDDFHLPPIGPGQISIVKKPSRQVNEIAKLDINKMQRAPRSLRFADESIGEEPSLATTDDSGRLSYHHRSSVENVPVTGFDALCKPNSRENSFEFIRPHSRSMVSREGTSMTSGSSFIIERIASGEWCECIDVDLNNLLCSECDCVGFHDKICSLSRSNSRLGLCPNCGKPVRRHRRSYRSSRETSITRREVERHGTCSRESLGRQSRPKVRSNYRKSMFNQDRMYSATDEDYMDVEEIIYDDDGYLSPGDDFDEEFETRRRNAKPWPTYDPTIHREAYARALGEARSRRIKKLQLEAFDEGLVKSTVTKPFVFSYYRLLPFIRKRDIGFQSLENTHDNERLKIKNGMKHIFGDVKVDDFYPMAKNGKNATNKITLKPKSTDIRTQVEVTNHTPV